ncbi:MULTISPECIES: DUF305 domain-containing protein [unclassified Coleofasciculus]|uniref:DUF305 domain-containing protein n=1 Tax=unclassified Coleofasciculus TaxID=2692782 RepID=UPI00187F9894|nr:MULTISPECIES: DUF305 domain-containing protein [unclassified Coleofasciculus]MBE9126120.1 DUF305 domain-containing protein [Coleofasciculus sp. LEGE 07081]MBE9147525.1 DUF305 domain-containing protein [Coleofasciculus sp. LEGE 07092]
MMLKKISLIILAGAGIATSATLAANPHLVSRAIRAIPFDNRTPASTWNGMAGQHMGMMQHMQADNEFEFFSLMIPHHKEAIDTAQLVLERSDRPEMRAFAQNIINVQSAELEQMQSWLDQWYLGQESSLTYTPMMRDLSQLQRDELDQAFLEDMIMHHMGAVMMSRMLVNHNLVEHEPVRPFAQHIATTQRDEIWQMRSWLKDWFGVAGMPGGMHGGRDGSPRRPGMGRMHQGW